MCQGFGIRGTAELLCKVMLELPCSAHSWLQWPHRRAWPGPTAKMVALHLGCGKHHIAGGSEGSCVRSGPTQTASGEEEEGRR